MNIEGLYTALVTPFHEDGSIDWDSLKQLVEFQIKSGVDGLVPMGTTGESPTVSHSENVEVIKQVVRYADGRVPVIAGTGSNSTAEAIRMTKQAADLGVVASLQVAPYYNKPTQEGLYRHFSTIAEETALPMVVYNIPGRTGINISTDTLMRLAENPNIVSVKEASGSFPQIMDVIQAKPDGFSVLSGDDNLFLPIILMGGSGVISVASNLIPAHMKQLVTAALRDQVETARSLHYQLLPLFRAMFAETNPIPIKYALAARGLIAQNKLRSPLSELSPAFHKQLDSVLAEAPVESL